ncbi:R3H domain-containing protein 1 [Podila clonocystis]|nr:R3H domain-containing protein 1 [Podila clonocystis]
MSILIANPVDDKSGAQQPKTPFTILKAAGPASSPSEEPPTPAIKIATRPKGPPDHAPSAEPSIDEALLKGMEALDVDEEGNENESTFDEFLITALKNRNDRIFLLKLELEFTNFINNQSQEQLDFPSLNSYYRMVIHRVANYFKLTRVVDPIHKTIIMYKTDESAIPALRFSDLMEEEEEQVVKPMKVLKRTPNRASAGAATLDGSAENDRRTVSIKEREEAYAKARARIFQEDVPKPKSPEEGSGANSRSDSPSTKSDTVEDQKSKSKKPNGRKAGSESRTPEEPDLDVQQNGASAASSRDVSRSTSPSLDPKAKGLKPKPKPSKSDLALECTDARRRKSTTPTSASGSRTHGLARTISSSSSQDGTHSPSLVTTLTESPTVNSPSNPILTKGPDYFGTVPQPNSGPFNSSRHQYTQKGQYDPNWSPGPGPGPNHAPGPNYIPHDPTSMPFNSMPASLGPDSVWNKPGGKKVYSYPGHTSSPAPQGKKNSLLYDYSTPTVSYDGTPKCAPEVEKPSALSHILEIYDFSPNDNIFDDLLLPSGSKLRRLKPAKDVTSSSSGQCLVVFKNAAMATEALTAFQEGRESWMGSSTALTFDEEEDASSSDDSQDTCARIQLRFNVRVWTPVLVNSIIPVGSTSSLSSSMAPSPSSATATTHPSPLGSQGGQDSTESNAESVESPESATENDGA